MRANYVSLAGDAIGKFYELAGIVRDSGLDSKLVLLIQLRASQINGCAFCMHMHALELRELGEREIRIDCLSTWRETDLYDSKEQAALAWTESVTQVATSHVSDEVYEAVRDQFTDKELAYLTIAISMINVWNRLNVAFRQDPRYAPALVKQMQKPGPVAL